MAFPSHSLLLRYGLKAFGGDTFGGYSAVPSPAAEVRTDTRKMRVYGRCTSETLDRSREIVRAKGVDWSEYEQNPIVTTNHGWRDPSKVVAHAVIDGKFTPTLTADGTAWDFGAQFLQTGPNAGHAAEAFGLVDTGVLRGVSLGFRFIAPDSRTVQARDGHDALAIERSKPFEITFLPVPDNPDAIVRVVEKGVNGRRLSQHWRDLLKPMVPKRKLHGFTTQQRREKAMPAQMMDDPNAVDQNADPNADPSMQQPQGPASQLPKTKPSIAFLLATEQYTMGFLRFLKDQMAIQDHPELKAVIPALMLHLSQAYRGLTATHQKIQSEDPAFPNMLGHGGLVSPDPMPGAAGPAAPGADPAAGDIPGQSPAGPGFGDGLDDATGPEINAGMQGDDDDAGDGPTADPQQGDDGLSDDGLSDDDLNSLGDDDGQQDDADPDADGNGLDDDQDADPVANPTDDEGDDDAPPPPKKKKKPAIAAKGFGLREDVVQRVREKGAAAGYRRAVRLLEAHTAGMRRDFAGTDLNLLRWAADGNLRVASPEQHDAFETFCREKAMQGVSRGPSRENNRAGTVSAVPPAMDSPEYLKAVEAEIARLLSAQQ